MTRDAGTVAELESHYERNAQIARACGAELRPDAYVFSRDPLGLDPWRPGYATLAFGRLRDELGLEGVRLHDLRHFNATNLLANGRLGHADASTTLNIYAHFVERTDQEAASLVGGLLDASRPEDAS